LFFSGGILESLAAPPRTQSDYSLKEARCLILIAALTSPKLLLLFLLRDCLECGFQQFIEGNGNLLDGGIGVNNFLDVTVGESLTVALCHKLLVEVEDIGEYRLAAL
jgi:hypothetical protein